MHRHECIPIPISQKSNQNACPIGDRAQKYHALIQATSMSHTSLVSVKLTECDPQVHCISAAMAAITKYHKLSGLSNIHVLTPCQVSGRPCSTAASREGFSQVSLLVVLHQPDWSGSLTPIFIWSSPGMRVFLST